MQCRIARVQESTMQFPVEDEFAQPAHEHGCPARRSAFGAYFKVVPNTVRFCLFLKGWGGNFNVLIVTFGGRIWAFTNFFFILPSLYRATFLGP